MFLGQNPKHRRSNDNSNAQTRRSKRRFNLPSLGIEEIFPHGGPRQSLIGYLLKHAADNSALTVFICLLGRYEGDTGLIVRVENNRVVLISDLTMHEMEILPKDLQLCTDMASGVDSLGKFEWGDLVNLDSETVGVIVRLERENFHVLNMHGTFKNRLSLKIAMLRSFFCR